MLSEKEPLICNHRALLIYFRASVYIPSFDEKRRLVFLDLIKKDISAKWKAPISIVDRHRDEVIQLVHLILLLFKN